MSSHYLTQCWNIVNWTLRNKIQWKLNRNSYIFIQENTFEKVVCKMMAILSQPHCVQDSLLSVRLHPVIGIPTYSISHEIWAQFCCPSPMELEEDIGMGLSIRLSFWRSFVHHTFVVSARSWTTEGIDLKLSGYFHYGTSQAWLTSCHTPLNFCRFLASGSSSSFWAFANKPLIGLSSNLVSQLIMDLP